MKAVLVIDIPEPIESDDIRVDYLAYYHCGNDIERKHDCRLRPLPEKKSFYFSAYAYNAMVQGYNECLEEILGETE